MGAETHIFFAKLRLKPIGTRYYKGHQGKGAACGGAVPHRRFTVKLTRFHLVTRHSSLATALALAALTAHAGVKYWDNLDFKAYDVGDYVQDGLVVNYDGIRNAGPNAPHDSTATTWANLGSWGNDYDLTRYSLVSSAWQEGGSRGTWSGNGFVSTGSNIFYRVDQAWTLPESYSIQTLTDATSSGQGGNIGYLICPYYDNTAPGGDSDMQDGGLWQKNDWARFAIGIRKTAFTYRNSLSSSMYLCSGDDIKGRVGVKQDHYQYMTVMLDSRTNAVIFSGIAAPWSTTTDARISSTAPNSSPWQNGTGGRTKRTFGKGVSIFGHYPRTDELFKGTLNSIRLYNKVLSDEEVAWNRVVDEYRFFGRGADIPVTNVVVATSVVGAEGDQPCGAYALDEDGFTFTAPAQRTVKGYRYLLNGYTIETWNGSDWVADGEGTHSGNSYKATASAIVCLTWQYTAVSGEGHLVVYDVDDYETNGLVVNYDGIRNAGPNAAHNPNAKTWVNCANPGSYDQKRYSLVNSAWVEDVSEGAWTDYGFVFNKKSVFLEPTSITIPSSYSMQVLVDAKASDQGGIGYIMCGQNATKWAYASIALRSNASIANTLYFNAMYPAASTSRPVISGGTYTYGTAILDETNAVLFAGTEAPWAAATTGGTTGHYMDSAYTPVEYPFPSGFSLGGHHPRTDELLKGTLKFYRLYNRVLSDAEVAKNRKVDNYRYFGIVSVTNVVVASTYSYLNGYDACGAYEVEGSYTFAAPESVTAPNGIEYACDGYILESWDDTAANWVYSSVGITNFYRYTSPAPVRLTWKWKATRGLRTAGDYNFEDYSPAGLRLHYDGLLNQGVGIARSTTATKWVNLGSDGATYDLSRETVGSAGVGEWTTNGYSFVGGSRFASANDSAKYVHWSSDSTAQVLVDADAADNINWDGHFIFAGAWNTFAMLAYGNPTNTDGTVSSSRRDKIWFNTQAASTLTTRPNVLNGSKYSFATAQVSSADRTATVFLGTTAPTSGVVSAGYQQFTDPIRSYNSRLFIAGFNSGNDGNRNLIGTVKNFRYYDRVLTEEELVRNRNVDAVRYFGELGVTNLVVEIEEGSSGITATPAAGAYYVEGSYNFSATRNGGTSALGYKIQEWNEATGAWVTKDAAEAASYSYIAATATKMKLVWHEIKPFVLILR